VLHDQLPWYIGGPVLGLCVVVIRVLLNVRLGVTGGYSEVVERLGRRSLAFDWRAWFLGGLVAGGLLFAALWGGPDFHGYGWLTATFTGGARVLVAVFLLGAGVLIGFGAKTAGGCTSGNGLGACSAGSPAGFAATATFMGTAIVTSFLIRGLT